MTEHNGCAVSSLAEMGDGYGFRKIRRELGVTAFGINAIVLPPGYELVGSASPGIVSTDPDGRVRISFLNDRDDQLPVKLIGRKLK